MCRMITSLRVIRFVTYLCYNRFYNFICNSKVIYLIFLTFCVCYLHTLSRYRECGYWKTVIYCLPIVLFWCLLIGGQYNVGVDYFSYLEMYETGDLQYVTESRGEFVFAWIVFFCRSIGITGQSIFVVFALIGVLILFYTMKVVLPSKYFFLFFLVFICMCGTFHNQMSGQRQYLAIYVMTFVTCLLLYRKFIIALVLCGVAVFIHQSSLIFLPALLVVYLFRNCNNCFFLVGVVLAGVAMSFVLDVAFVEKIVSSVSDYGHYIDRGIIEESQLIVRITKYIYVPLILWAIYKFHKMFLSRKQSQFFVIGTMGFAIKVSVLSLFIVDRIGRYLEIFSCLPIVFLLIYYKKTRRIECFIFILLYLMTPYLVKVLTSQTGGYSYDSILLHLD